MVKSGYGHRTKLVYVRIRITTYRPEFGMSILVRTTHIKSTPVTHEPPGPVARRPLQARAQGNSSKHVDWGRLAMTTVTV